METNKLPYLGIYQNSRTKQTWLYSRKHGEVVKATRGEYEMLYYLARMIRSQIHEPQEIIDAIEQAIDNNKL